MIKKIVLLFILISFNNVFSQETNDDVIATSLVKENQKAPDFLFKTVDGKTIHLSDYKGKIVLINFFATWCGPCMKEMPYLQKDLWDKLKNNPKFVLLSFGRDHTQEEINKFIEAKKFTFPIYADKGKSVYSLFASKYIPRNYLIDSNGTIVYTSSGYTPEEFEVLKNKINDLIKG